MRFLNATHIPFMKHRGLFLGVSALLVVISLGLVLTRGLVMGVDFAGGTQITVKFKSTPDVGRIRAALEELKLGAVTIQRFDEAERNEVLLRVQNPGQEGDFSSQMIAALDRVFNEGEANLRLNLQGSDVVRDRLVEADPDAVGGSVEARREHYEPMAEAILEKRKEVGLLPGPESLQGLEAVSAGVRGYLSSNARFGEFAVLAVDNVGPAVGKDLRNKAAWAVGLSILAILAYIAFRFQFQYGIGAVVALIHDTVIALGALSLTGRELEIPTIAALLTLVGYSVNDTVVIFDRVRERLRLDRGKPLEQVMDTALNQTLSRTVITSGLTLIVVISLFVFGGDVINTFAFVLMLGIIVGTYSSIYIASPIALAVSNWRESRKRGKARPLAAAAGGARARR